MSFKCDAGSYEDTAGKTNMGETFTDWVELACVVIEDHQETENNVGADEEEVSKAKETKQMVENTFNGSLTKDHKAEHVPN